jgi:ATP-dependent DNA helicase RecG
MEEAERGRRRIAFDDVLTYRLALGGTRIEANEAGAPEVRFEESFAKKFVAALPFTLTDDQKRAAWASFKDMERGVPMRRLLQGDVGSGKTVVAAFLMAMTFRSSHSAVLMVPTEILAKQHAESVRRFLTGADHVPFLLLTSSDKRIWEGGEEKKLKLQEARDRMSQGRVTVVGTHALLYRDMLPKDTALVVVDEQHRFGVAQREAITVARRPDGMVPHLLSMTATPIPRSLALTLYGDLDISIIRTKPKGRLEIKSRVLVGEQREQAYDAIRSEVRHGHRAFIICPLIDESDKLGVKSVTEEAKRLASGPLKGLRIGLLHGRLSSTDKDGVMNTFAEGLLDVLVSTTVVEVGVDVPEATVMAIEGAERFGLAQLHQLRGRVGRSVHQSFCYLMTDADGMALDRLKVLEKTNDGFVIAEEDLKRRGSGNLLGTQQSGQALFRAARPTDIEIMASAKEAAEELLASDPDLKLHQPLRTIVERIRETSHHE